MQTWNYYCSTSVVTITPPPQPLYYSFTPMSKLRPVSSSSNVCCWVTSPSSVFTLQSSTLHNLFFLGFPLSSSSFLCLHSWSSLSFSVFIFSFFLSHFLFHCFLFFPSSFFRLQRNLRYFLLIFPQYVIFLNLSKKKKEDVCFEDEKNEQIVRRIP